MKKTQKLGMKQFEPMRPAKKKTGKEVGKSRKLLDAAKDAKPSPTNNLLSKYYKEEEE